MVWQGKPGSGDLIMDSDETISAGTGSFSNVTVGSQLGYNVASGVQLSVNSLHFPNPIVGSAANVGSAAGLPATPEGYLTISVSGTNMKVPYFRE